MNSRDTNFRRPIQAVSVQALHIIQLSKLASRIDRHKLLKLIERLQRQISAINEEEDTFSLTMCDQAIDTINRHIRFTATRHHLYQSTRTIFREGLFQISNRFKLTFAQIGP